MRGVIVGRAKTCPLSVFSPLFSSGQERCGFRSTVVHTHPFNGPFSGTTQVSWYQKGKSNLDFTEARDSEWQWHQLGHMQVCTLLQTDIHTSTPPLSFLQARCPSCRPTNSVKAPKARSTVVVTCFTYIHCVCSVQADYEQELALQRASHKRELARSREEVAQLMAAADASSIPVDEELVRRRYMKEIEHIKVQWACIKLL